MNHFAHYDLIRIHQAELRRAADECRMASAVRAAQRRPPWMQRLAAFIASGTGRRRAVPAGRTMSTVALSTRSGRSCLPGDGGPLPGALH